MLQIEHLLLTGVAALVPRHALPLLPNFDIGRQQLHARARARLQWSRVPVGAHFHTAFAIHDRKAGLGQLKSFRRQRQQMLTLDPHGFAHGVRFARDPPLFLGTAAIEQKLIQLV